MSIFFDEDKALTPKANESWSKGPRTDISENFAAVSKAFSMTEFTQSELRNNEEEYGNVVQLLHENGNSNFTNPVDIESIMGGSQYHDNENLEVVGYRQVDNVGDIIQTQANFWKQVEEVKKSNPEIALKLTEAGLDNHDNMKKVIAKKKKESEEYFRAAEPVTHDDWLPTTRRLRESYQWRGYAKRLKGFINVW